MVYPLKVYLIALITLIGTIVFAVRMLAIAKCSCSNIQATILPDSVYTGQDVNLKVDSKCKKIYQQFWNFGDGSISTEGKHKYRQAGTYTIWYILNGNCRDTLSVTVSQNTMIAEPELTIEERSAFYIRDSVHFQANVPGSDTLFWDFGDGNRMHSISKNISHIYKSKGTYTVSLKGNHTIKIATASITIEEQPKNFHPAPRQIPVFKPKTKSKSNEDIVIDSTPPDEPKKAIEPVQQRPPNKFDIPDIRNMLTQMANFPDDKNAKGSGSNFEWNYSQLKKICENMDVPVVSDKYGELKLKEYCAKLKTYKKKLNPYKINTLKMDTNALGFITGLTVHER